MVGAVRPACTRSRREAEALGACPGCDPTLLAVLPGGYAWLVARHLARAATCLKGKGGTTEL